MQGETLHTALARLRRSLALGEEEEEPVLSDALERAWEDILRYLGRDSLPPQAEGLLVELAALKVLRARAYAGYQSESYGEGQLSQSERCFSPLEYQQGEQALLATLAPLRQVHCGREKP